MPRSKTPKPFFSTQTRQGIVAKLELVVNGKVDPYFREWLFWGKKNNIFYSHSVGKGTWRLVFIRPTEDKHLRFLHVLAIKSITVDEGAVKAGKLNITISKKDLVKDRVLIMADFDGITPDRIVTTEEYQDYRRTHKKRDDTNEDEDDEDDDDENEEQEEDEEAKATPAPDAKSLEKTTPLADSPDEYLSALRTSIPAYLASHSLNKEQVAVLTELHTSPIRELKVKNGTHSDRMYAIGKWTYLQKEKRLSRFAYRIGNEEMAWYIVHFDPTTKQITIGIKEIIYDNNQTLAIVIREGSGLNQ